MYQKILQRLGLSEDESRIYLFLIENPKQSLSDISNTLYINRPRLYKILPNMIESGIVGTVLSGKRKYYIAESPEILQSYFNKLRSDFDTIIPQIHDMFGNHFSKPVFKHLSGKIGIKNIFMDIANTLHPGDIFYRYSSRNSVEKSSIPLHQWNEYKKIRDKKKLERMVITNDYLNQLKPNKLEKEVVIIPKEFDLFEDNITKIIYANKVAIIDYNSNECFIIESQIFANFERKIFTLLFHFLKKL